MIHTLSPTLAESVPGSRAKGAEFENALLLGISIWSSIGSLQARYRHTGTR